MARRVDRRDGSMMKNEPEKAPASPRLTGDLNPRSEPALDFPDRDLGQLSPRDYEILGFISGLEVHQQLLTQTKLFCRCPAGKTAARFDAEVLRHMRPTLSELGEYDGTALMEFKTNKDIVYRLERETVCTYEMDDTPPFEINDEATRIAVEIALLFNLNLVSELHVMRKQYLDGSIPTGFQRTSLIGLTGAIPFRVPELGIDRELRIRQLSLEEDSCREVSDVGHTITFSTDRLGTPLAEAVTEPELLTPLEVQAAGRLLARVAQSSGKIRRGPGMARQDVNVSVAGGRRVELKGVDHQRGLPLLVHNEAYRQLNLLKIREELERRGVEASMLELSEQGLPWEASALAVDASRALRQCDFTPIREAMARGMTICAVRLRGFGGLLNRRTQPGVTFARELAGRVRVIACLETPFMLHSDLGDFGLRPTEWGDLKRALRAEDQDSVVVVWGPERDAATAVREVLIRAGDALVGVPSETRQTFADGTNGFERILPGPDRMYPDTDTPPRAITDRTVAEITASLPEQPWDRDARYEEKGLDAAAAQRLAAAPWSGLFDELDPAAGPAARRLAFALEKRIPHHRRRLGLEGLPEAQRLRPLVDGVCAGTIGLEALEPALDLLLEQPSRSIDDVLAPFRPQPGDDAALAAAVQEVAECATRLRNREHEVIMRWVMGRVMPRFLGRHRPSEVRERLRQALTVTARRSPK